MYIPFNNLYHYIESRIAQPAVFYLFLPPGSKKINDITPLRAYDPDQIPLMPKVICHDQECVDWDQYTDQQCQMRQHRLELNQHFQQDAGVQDWLQLHDLNLDQATCRYGGISVFDRTVLLHSELNSPELERYARHGYQPAYWFSHAMIARDWYRYAQHDQRLRPQPLTKPFLIYCRGFTGSREYRPKFLEALIDTHLVSFSHVSCLDRENHQDLCRFQSVNPDWRVASPEKLLALPRCGVDSTASADYDPEHISTTACQIVLETQFDRSCLHLTEKTLRPLATAQPFMLLAAPGALALLRRYGFQTYSGLIDESYDQITDPVARMRAVLVEMSRLSSMDTNTWNTWRSTAQVIARANQARFFSPEFADFVMQECVTNLDVALRQVMMSRGHRWLAQRRQLRLNRPRNWHQYLHRPNERAKATVLRQLRQGRYTPSQSDVSVT